MPSIQVDVSVIADLRKYYTDGDHSEFLSPEEVSHVEKKLSDSIRSASASSFSGSIRGCGKVNMKRNGMTFSRI